MTMMGGTGEMNMIMKRIPRLLYQPNNRNSSNYHCHLYHSLQLPKIYQESITSHRLESPEPRLLMLLILDWVEEAALIKVMMG